jgi:protein involved in polysaccharide export with SLBB domain
MMILMLAAAMTVAMLIATAFGLREEAERVRVETRRRQANRYGLY